MIGKILKIIFAPILVAIGAIAAVLMHIPKLIEAVMNLIVNIFRRR
tara:strand:- start:83 stop:220 length:138 start_codon:yes stop_codon:yes gene_type:complete